MKLLKHIVFLFCCLAGSLQLLAQTGEKPNIILIVFDDLNDWVQPFGGHPQVETPTLNMLSTLGTNFTNAYCTGPVCAPSRTSFLLGKNPTYTGVYNNEEFDESNFRANFPPDKYIITLPEYLKDYGGYYTVCLNKIFHADQYKNDYDTSTADPCSKSLSWNEMIYTGNDGGIINEGESLDQDISSFEWAQIEDAYTNDMQDHTITNEAIDFLNNYDADPSNYCNKPFFMALGYHKPHLQLYIPEQYFLPYYITDFNATPYTIPYNYPVNSFPYNGVVLAPQPDAPYADFDSLGFVGKSLAAIGVHNDFMDWGDSIANTLTISDTLDTDATGEILGYSKIANATMAYLAAIKFVDEQLGEFWTSLNDHPELLNNSVIIITSDHGYSLDEKKHWKKNTLWETDIRVPFIMIDMRDPEYKKCTVNVSLLDIFPTVCDLTDNPYPLFPDSTKYLDGKSLAPILYDSTLHYESPVLTTYKAEAGKQVSCMEQYSVRNERFHYIQYHSNNINGNLSCDSLNSIQEEELYEIGKERNIDPNEWNNLEADPDYAPVIEYLSQWTPGHPMYTKKTFNPEIKYSLSDCLLNAGDSVTMHFDLYDSTGVLITPPENYAYFWTNNISTDTITGLQYDFTMSNPEISDSIKRVVIYLHMIDTSTNVIAGFEMAYLYLSTAEVPSVSFLANTQYLSTTVVINNISISGAYNSVWWDFGDGTTFNGLFPGPHTYTQYGKFDITCHVAYGNTDSCVITRTQPIETISFDYYNNNRMVVFPNPTAGVLNLATKELVTDGDITVTDITGVMRFHQTLQMNTFLIHHFDFSALDPGIYTLTLKTANFTNSVKFIKI